MPDFGAIINRSIAVVKKSKWLLVYGLILASSAGGGSGGGPNFDSDDIESLKNPDKNIPQNLPQQTKEVLGVYTDNITDWLRSVPLSTWLWLVLGIFAAIIIGILIIYIVNNWAKGSLIFGVDKALKNEEVNLRSSSPAGLKVIKPLLYLSVWMTLIVLAVLLAIPLIWVLFFFLFQDVEILKTIWILVGAFGAIDIMLFLIIFLPMVSIYAERLIVLKNMTPKQAIKKSFSLSKKGFFATAVMGIINFIINATVGCISIIVMLIFLGIPGFIFLYPAINNKRWPTVPEISILVLILILFVILMRVVGALITVFKYANWNQLFEEIYNKVENTPAVAPVPLPPQAEGKEEHGKSK